MIMYFILSAFALSTSLGRMVRKSTSLAEKRSVPQWHSHIISSVDICSQASVGEILLKRRYSTKPRCHIQKAVLLNMVNQHEYIADIINSSFYSTTW